MDNGQTTIKELFIPLRIFEIPKYQRAYAWGTDKQLPEFLEDIKNQKSSKDYFLGTILFKFIQDDDDFEVVDIVDGQQRITTIVIFMKCLLNRLHALDVKDKNIESSFVRHDGRVKLRVLKDDADIFSHYIMGDKSIPAKSMIKTPSQKRLIEAKKFFTDELAKCSKTELLAYKQTIFKTKILQYSVNDNAEATLIFETTNDRGLGLTNLEKSKSFLMHKVYLSVDELSNKLDNELDIIQSLFSEIYRDYEPIEDRIEENQVLQYHFIAFEKWKSTKEKKGYTDYVSNIKRTINTLIKEGKNTEALEFIKKYSFELRETFGIIRELLETKIYPVLDLLALGQPANFYPLLIKAYKFDSTKDKSFFKRVAQLCEMFCFRQYGIMRSPAYTARERLYDMARDFEGTNYEELISNLKALLDDYCNDSRFESELRDYNFYSLDNSDINYFFWKYENHLRRQQPIASPMSRDELLTKDRKTKLSIEHIYPQNPDNRKVISNNIKLFRINEKFEEQWLHSIGNLTIDPSSANSSKSNKEFESKNSKYFVRAPFKTQNELEDFLNQKNKKWDETSIRKRAEIVIQFALDEWNYKRV